MIKIIDYGYGNITAIKNVYDRLNIPSILVSDPCELQQDDKIILPGVGNFDECMRALRQGGFDKVVLNTFRSGQGHVLGICVGLQMLLEGSAEGLEPGLSIFDGRCDGFGTSALMNPHLGWSKVNVKILESGLFKNVNIDEEFYFVHSYHAVEVPLNNVLCTASNGMEFCAAVQRGNIYGVQFHPEKSHGAGEKILKNYSNL